MFIRQSAAIQLILEVTDKLFYQVSCLFSELVKSMVYVVISDLAAFSNHYLNQSSYRKV